MRLALATLALLAMTSTLAVAQPGRSGMVEIPVEKLGNFEIQDLIISIQYEDEPRSDGLVSAKATARAPEGGDLSIQRLYLGGGLGDENSTIEMLVSFDGTLVGRGLLPHPSKMDGYQLRMDEDGKLGFNIGMPPTIRGDFEGGARGEGWKIEISMDWPLDVDIVIES